MTAKDEHLKHCFSCRFDGDPFKNDELLEEFRLKVIKEIVKKLEDMKRANDKQRGSLPKEQWKRSDGWSDALDAAIKKIKLSL